MNDFYDIFEIDKDSDKEAIKKQYKKLILKYHPDKNKGCKLSEQKFIEIKNIYEIFIDDKKRYIYDCQQKFKFLKDLNLTDENIYYLIELYEKIYNMNEIKLFRLLYNTLPDNIKVRFSHFKDIFNNKKSKDIIIPSKYINIQDLNENFTIKLNIKIEDIYCKKLKKIIIHTKTFICYLYLRYFSDITIKNGNKNFIIKFVIREGNFIKKDDDLLIIKKINIYELLFKKEYEIRLPNNEQININLNNLVVIKGMGFQKDYYSNVGNCIVLFNLNYNGNYQKYKEDIKSIFN
jgi:DnaJ-class molecular chaperone